MTGSTTLAARLVAHVSGETLPVDGMRWLADYPSAGAHDHPALVFRGTVITYGALDRQASEIAALFLRLGCGCGARVAFLGKNSEIYFSILVGAMRSGSVLVPLNWRCTATELSFIIDDAGATLIICDAELEPLARTSAPSVRIMTIEGETGLRAAMDDEPALNHWSVDPEAPALLMFTSGTTGMPKGVVITQRMFALGRQAELRSLDYANWRAGDVILSAMPNFHMAACCWVQCALVRGLSCVISDDPSPANILKLCDEYHVTHTFIVPTVVRALVDLMEEQEISLPYLREIHYGAAPMDTALLERTMKIIGCGFLQHYGMTENAGTATRLAPKDHDLTRPHLLRSIGRPQPGLDLEIRRADLSVADRDEPGEIWLRSPTMMPGYWNRPNATKEVIVNGWYRSGDGGFINADGYLYLTDRIKDMVVTGGENVYPIEIEAAIRLHPAVADVVVFGQPDERWGEIVVAAVELYSGMEVSEDELRGHVRGLLAGFKVPKRYIFDLALPRTATGKLQRGAARAAALAG